MTTLLTAISTAMTATQANSSKSIFDKLPSRAKRMLLYLASKDGAQPEISLNPNANIFFDQETTTEAYQLLQDRLQKMKVGSSMPTMGTTAAAHSGTFIANISACRVT